MASDDADALLAIRRELARSGLSGPQRRLAQLAWLDWVGVCLAGAAEPVALAVRRYVQARHPGDAALAGGGRASVPGAALANGVSGHALDFDDTHLGYGGHPSSTVAPVALALAAERRLPGEALLTALAVGVESACAVGERLGPGHARSGWHPTATAGVFGAAAAAGFLLDLDDRRLRHAFALSAVRAAGLRAAFGTDAKPYQVGAAATAGVEAALLAQEGVEGPADAMGAAMAVFSAQGGGAACAARPPGAALEGLLFKSAPCCFGIQAAAEAAAGLGRRIGGAEVARVEVRIPATFMAICALPDPRTPTEARFSVAYVVALALLRRPLAHGSAFSTTSLADPGVRRLLTVTAVRGDPDAAETAAQVRIEAGGEALEARVDLAGASADLDTLEARLRRKFLDLTDGAVADREGLAETLLALGACGDAERLASRLAAPRPASQPG